MAEFRRRGFEIERSAFYRPAQLPEGAPIGKGPALPTPSLWGQEATTVAGYLTEVVAQRQADGDSDVAFADINVDWIGAGCNGHPSVATHEAMGAKLAVALGQAFAW